MHGGRRYVRLDELAKALGVVKQDLRSVPAGGIKAISGDTSARAVEKVFRAGDITLASGMVYICVPSEGPYHAHPVDCWRFQRDCWAGLASWCRRAVLVESYEDDSDPLWKDNVGIFKVRRDESRWPAPARSATRGSDCSG